MVNKESIEKQKAEINEKYDKVMQHQKEVMDLFSTPKHKKTESKDGR